MAREEESLNLRYKARDFLATSNLEEAETFRDEKPKISQKIQRRRSQNFLGKMAREEESLNLRYKARDLLATPSHEEAEILVEQLSMPQETNEFQTALTLFDFCVDNFPNCLTLKLLSLYLRSSNGFLRFRSIYLLSDTLSDFRTRNFDLSPVALLEIKPLLIECLTMQETKESDIKILRRIVSLITYNVVISFNGGWDQLSDCILSLANQEPVKGFHVFIELPLIYRKFIYNFMDVIVEKAEKVLLNPENCEVEHWSIALETVVKMGIQLCGRERRIDVNFLIKNLLNILMKSVKKLLYEMNEEFLVLGLEHFERFLSGDKILCSYNKEQCYVVKILMDNIKTLGTVQKTKEIMEKINQLVKEPVNQVSIFKVIPFLINPKDDRDGAEFDPVWYENFLQRISSVDLLKLGFSNDLEARSREIAIKRLEVVLSHDHISKKVEIDFAEFVEIRELQQLLISGLGNKGISGSMFRVLGEVVRHVVNEMCKHQEVEWCGLRDYIASKRKTEFHRAVYIFTCLTMPLDDDKFVIPVMENLLPEITMKLNLPRDSLVVKRNWVLAFAGAFCATIHTIKITTHADSVKEITKKMIDSVIELVEGGTEAALVTTAFKHLEIIVKKQLEWYKTVEYKFVKGLLLRLYAIRGMKWESKIILWRINRIVEKRVNEEVKELPKGDFDWLNLPEA